MRLVAPLRIPSDDDTPGALASFLIGSHHRVSHVALVEWLERNQKFQRDGV